MMCASVLCAVWAAPLRCTLVGGGIAAVPNNIAEHVYAMMSRARNESNYMRCGRVPNKRCNCFSCVCVSGGESESRNNAAN